MFEKIIYDIETNGFLRELTKLTCIVIQDYTNLEIKAFHDSPSLKPWNGMLSDGIKIINEAKVKIAHNQKNFDILAMKKVREDYDPIENQIDIDSLALSRLLFPEQREHSIEAWAKKLKLPVQKVQNTEWDVLTQNILDRCIADVEINTATIKYLWSIVNQQEKEGSQWFKALMTEQEIFEIHGNQVVHGVDYDVKLAKETLVKFDAELLSLKDRITKGAPDIISVPSLSTIQLDEYRKISKLSFCKPINLAQGNKKPFKQIKRKTINKPFKKDGTLTVKAMRVFISDKNPWSQVDTVKAEFSEYKPVTIDDKYTTHVINWFGKDMVHTVQGQYNKLELKPMNLNADGQVKKYLYSLGWKPDEWNSKRQPDGSFKRTSPKLSESSFGSIPLGLGQDIKTYRTLKHRRSMIESLTEPLKKGALSKVRDDGRVPAEAITLGTPTARYRHTGACCNVPRPSSLYGEEIRKLFKVPDGHLMIGIDLSGIEARMLAHGCYPFPGGPEFAALVTAGDWHSENAALWSCDRNDAKTELYALMFGAGPLKLGNILGKSAKVGKANKVAFMEKYKPYALLQKSLEEEYISTGKKYILGLDGRRLFVRSLKDVLNTYCQGNAAIIFKNWMIKLRDIRESFSVRVEQIIA